jgi:hypothetical protein
MEGYWNPVLLRQHVYIYSVPIKLYLIAIPQTKLKAYAATELKLYVPIPLKR